MHQETELEKKLREQGESERLRQAEQNFRESQENFDESIKEGRRDRQAWLLRVCVRNGVVISRYSRWFLALCCLSFFRVRPRPLVSGFCSVRYNVCDDGL